MATKAEVAIQQIENTGATMSRTQYIEFLTEIIDALKMSVEGSRDDEKRDEGQPAKNKNYIQNDPHMPAGPGEGSEVQTSKGPPMDEEEEEDAAPPKKGLTSSRLPKPTKRKKRFG